MKPLSLPRTMFYTPLKNILENIVYDISHEKEKPAFHSNYINKIISPVGLRRNCLDYKYCLLAFFDSTDTEANLESFNTQMSKLEKLKRNPRNEDIQFNWVDIKCHSDLAAKFGISQENKNIPGMAFVYPWRNVYATFKGLWDPFILDEYLERSMANRYETKDIAREDIVLTNLNCGQEDEEVTEEPKSVTKDTANAAAKDEDKIDDTKIEL
jgi:hypothetical protein